MSPSRVKVKPRVAKPAYKAILELEENSIVRKSWHKFIQNIRCGKACLDSEYFRLRGVWDHEDPKNESANYDIIGS